MSKQALNDFIVMEELFLDQLEFKISAIFELQTIKRRRRKEIISFLKRLSELTRENLEIANQEFKTSNSKKK